MTDYNKLPSHPSILLKVEEVITYDLCNTIISIKGLIVPGNKMVLKSLSFRKFGVILHLILCFLKFKVKCYLLKELRRLITRKYNI